MLTELIVRNEQGEEVVARRLVASNSEDMRRWVADYTEIKAKALMNDVAEAFITLYDYYQRKPQTEQKKKKR